MTTTFNAPLTLEQEATADRLLQEYVFGQVDRPGVYKGSNGVYYRFKQTRTGKIWPHVITKTDTGVEFAFSVQGFRFCVPASRLTVDECEALSLVFGSCVICGRTLTVKKSVEAGMGPVCRKKY